MGKLTSKVLWGRVGICRAPGAGDGAIKFSPSCEAGWGGDGVRQNLAGWGRRPYPSDSLRPIAIPIGNNIKWGFCI